METQLALKMTKSNINEILIWDFLPWLEIVLRSLRIWLRLNLRRQPRLKVVVVLVATEIFEIYSSWSEEGQIGEECV